MDLTHFSGGIIMTTNVDLEKLQKDAVDIFNQGFACSESVIYAIKENFELDMSDDAIAMSSGIPMGGLAEADVSVVHSPDNDVYRIFLRT